MRLFIEGQKIICTRKKKTYFIHDYFLKKPDGRKVELILDQAISEGLKLHVWKGTKSGKPDEVWITNLSYTATFDGRRGLDFTLLPAGPSRQLPELREPRRGVNDWLR